MIATKSFCTQTHVDGEVLKPVLGPGEANTGRALGNLFFHAKLPTRAARDGLCGQFPGAAPEAPVLQK